MIEEFFKFWFVSSSDHKKTTVRSNASTYEGIVFEKGYEMRYDSISFWSVE